MTDVCISNKVVPLVHCINLVYICLGNCPAFRFRRYYSEFEDPIYVAGNTDHTADSFSEFFDKKVRDVRSATARLPPPPISRTASSSLASFRPCTQTEVCRIIMQSPDKSCMLDPVPTFLVRESVDLLLPFLTTLVNTSLMQGRFPASQKHE